MKKDGKTAIRAALVKPMPSAPAAPHWCMPESGDQRHGGGPWRAAAACIAAEKWESVRQVEMGMGYSSVAFLSNEAITRPWRMT